MARLCEAVGLNEVRSVRLNKAVRGAYLRPRGWPVVKA